MRSFQKIQWMFVVVLLIGLVGCNSGDGGLTTPTTVTGSDAGPTLTIGSASPANFSVGRGQNKLGVYVPEKRDGFQVQVPEGAFMIEYSVKGGGTYFIVVTAEEEGAVLGIGLLEGFIIDDVLVYEGNIAPTAPDPEIAKEGVKIYVWPGSETYAQQTWTGVFVMNPSIVVIILVLDGEIEEGQEIEEIKCINTIRTYVNDPTKGKITPAGPLERPCNSSASFTIEPASGNFGDIKDVLLNGISVKAQVQELGNGNGHLVIHKIDMNIEMKVEFQ